MLTPLKKDKEKLENSSVKNMYEDTEYLNKKVSKLIAQEKYDSAIGLLEDFDKKLEDKKSKFSSIKNQLKILKNVEDLFSEGNFRDAGYLLGDLADLKGEPRICVKRYKTLRNVLLYHADFQKRFYDGRIMHARQMLENMKSMLPESPYFERTTRLLSDLERALKKEKRITDLQSKIQDLREKSEKTAHEALELYTGALEDLGDPPRWIQDKIENLSPGYFPKVKESTKSHHTTAYCVKCKTKKEMKNPQKVTMKNGKPARRGSCSDCGTGMFILEHNEG